MYSIDFQLELDGVTIPAERMSAAIQGILDQHEIQSETALSVVISDDEHVRDLNRQFRQVDAPTDILSFPADAPPLPPDDTDIPDADTEPPYLGDLIIAYPYTAHQAEAAGHPIEDELVLLVIHGTLHLLGYDHDTPEHQDAMWAEQAAALERAGVPIKVPRFTFESGIGDDSDD